MSKKKRQILVLLCISSLVFSGCKKSNIEEESLIALSQSASKTEHLATQGETKKLSLGDLQSKEEVVSSEEKISESSKENESSSESVASESESITSEETYETPAKLNVEPASTKENLTKPQTPEPVSVSTEPQTTQTETTTYSETTTSVQTEPVTERQVMQVTEGVALTIEQADTISRANYNEYYTYIVEVANLINQFRAENGLGAISLDYTNCIVAGIRSAEGAHLDYFSHERPDGTKVSTVINYYGIPWDRCGENLGRRQVTPQEIVEDWKNSDAGHREIMLKTEWTSMGIGIARDSEGDLYWTAVFIQN